MRIMPHFATMCAFSGGKGMVQEDLRTHRTRDALQQTFRQMLWEMDYENITIKELTSRANVNRRTFYLHYDSLDQLLDELMDEIADNYIKETKQMNGLTEMPQIVRAFLTYFAMQDALHEKIICHGNFRYISDRINRRIIEENQGPIDHLGNTDVYTKNLMISYLNASALGMYRKWVADKKRIPLEDFINLATQLICSGILSAPDYLNKVQKALPPI